jgi:pyridinium-3,5-biscarboxylic acid mononucleotide synthase
VFASILKNLYIKVFMLPAIALTIYPLQYMTTKVGLKELLRQYKEGTLPESKLITLLSQPTTDQLGFATIDRHRTLRKGFPEVIYCAGKTNDQISAIAATIVKNKQPLLATRATPEQYKAVKKKVPNVRYHETARCITLGTFPTAVRKGIVCVVTAGTSDIPVAEEAVITLKCLGSPVEQVNDVGVAGIHRLFDKTDILFRASVIIVVAGMEGALASVIGGLVEVPVIAVPTSVGYGTSFGGIAALLAMLNSCATGVTVVNIDNGFGAGFAAHLMNKI